MTVLHIQRATWLPCLHFDCMTHPQGNINAWIPLGQFDTPTRKSDCLDSTWMVWHSTKENNYLPSTLTAWNIHKEIWIPFHFDCMTYPQGNPIALILLGKYNTAIEKSDCSCLDSTGRILQIHKENLITFIPLGKYGTSRGKSDCLDSTWKVWHISLRSSYRVASVLKISEWWPILRPAGWYGTPDSKSERCDSLLTFFFFLFFFVVFCIFIF